MSDTAAVWRELTDYLRDLEALEGAGAVLAWDQQVMMPKKAAASRGDQSAVLARIGHEWLTDARVGRWIDALKAAPDLDPVQKGCLRNLDRAWSRATKVSPALVTKIAVAQSKAFSSWVEAKQTSDFAKFAPDLQTLLDLTRERIAAIDATRHPYDVMLEEFDPGTTVASLKTMFARLREGLVELLTAVEKQPQVAPLERSFDLGRQRALSREVAKAMGYDFDAGRLDDSEHPFTIGMHPHDVRITTHLYADDLLGGLGGTVHETGHALYEQGLPVDLRGTLTSKAASFGLHESQSRFWENFVGRSLAFSRWLEGRLRAQVGDDAPSADEMFRAANRIHPGLIRIKADEVTYNLHIIVRFEIELALFEGRLKVADLPEAWNAKYAEYLGVRPKNDAEGVLQDVHWSGAAFAYFPSYTLGNLYAASLGAAISQAIPDLWTRIEQGDFAPILGWLRQNVHSKGNVLEAPEIVRQAVGERDSVKDLLDHLWGRQGAMYGVQRS